ncbi:MAG TPA: hypothetical protein VH853_10100 [Polyangia bacterium]|jgi:hypothetical protein|nr:hypothetical protein [Polyangia bacterium]
MTSFKRISLTGAVALTAVGCFGGNPNQNSMLTDGAVVATGGTTGGGTGGSGGPFAQSTPIAGVPLATFDTNAVGFSFSTFNEIPNLAVNNQGTDPTLAWNGADGSPSPGALQVTAPYFGANQYVDIQSKNQSTDASASVPMCMGCLDWTGGKLHVRIKVDAGSTFVGQIEPYADTTVGYKFVGTSLNVAMDNNWHDYVVNLSTAMTQISGFDLSQVILFGVHIGTGTAPAVTPTPVTFEIDSFSIEGAPNATGAGGAGGAAGASGIGGSGGHASQSDAAVD